MANNPYVNKVVYGDTVLMDTSEVTVDKSSLELGKTALDASGALITGERVFVDGVKGNAESSYRTGSVNLTPANIGAVDKTGDTMTGVLKTNSNIVQTSGYIKGRDESSNDHALKLGHDGDNKMEFHECGGQFDFYKTIGGIDTLLFQVKDGNSSKPLPINNGGTGATDAATARTNLGVYSKAEVDSSISALMSNAIVRGESNKRYLKISKVSTAGTGLYGSICIVTYNRALIAYISRDEVTELLTSASKITYTVDTTNHEIVFDGASVYAHWLVIFGGGSVGDCTFNFYNP